jgi:hypothetical protein
MPTGRAAAPVTLEAKVGILRDRLVVEGAEVPLRREGDGWITVPPVGARSGGRVRYEALRDRIRIESPAGRVLVPFHWRHTSFSFGGRTYRLGPMAWGHIMVSQEDRPVATGRVTMSGVRLGYVAPELEPIAPELAVGLAYRAVTMWLAAGTAGAAH